MNAQTLLRHVGYVVGMSGAIAAAYRDRPKLGARADIARRQRDSPWATASRMGSGKRP